MDRWRHVIEPAPVARAGGTRTAAPSPVTSASLARGSKITSQNRCSTSSTATGSRTRSSASVRPGRTRKASEIEARLELLDGQYVEGKVSKARFDRMNAALLAQLSGSSDRRAPARDRPPARTRPEPISEVGQGMPAPTRRRIISAVVESLTVSKATGHGPINPERVALVWGV